MKLLLMLLVACSPRIVRVPVTRGPLQVEITKVPALASCWLPDMPDVPHQLYELEEREPDVMKRMWIHRREFEELLEYMRWWRLWAEYIQDCFKDTLNIP